MTTLEIPTRQEIRSFDNGLALVYDDGGRAEAGFKGTVKDCVVRSIAIITREPYREVYNTVRRMSATKSIAKYGVDGDDVKKVMKHFGGKWTATMHVGSGTTVHMRPDELPQGRIIVRVSHHVSAVIDGIAYDISDFSRAGKRAVYGYWTFEEKN